MSAGYRLGCAYVPLQEDQPCGDAGALWDDPDAGCSSGVQTMALVDGLGHGEPAAQAAEAALDCIAQQRHLPLAELLIELDRALRGTRGAAVGLARLSGRSLRYAGIGNTRALRWRGDQWSRLSSQHGIVGDGLRGPIQVAELDMQPGDWWLMFSDGLQEMIRLPLALPEWQRDPELLCRHLLQHFRQGLDDAGVLALHLELG
jgi:serine phosphatase RsbU (regulator of sigma subunit)